MGLVSILVWVVVILVGLGLAVMLIFGLRSIAYGKVDIKTIIIMALPLLVLLILGFVMGSWAEAAIYAVLISLAGAIVALLFSGLRGLVS